MRSRNDLADWLPKDSFGAELGVEKGEYSSELIARVHPAKFFMVDIFTGQYLTTKDLSVEYERLKNLYQGDQRVEVVRSDTIDWLTIQPDNSLDWVYIDSSHEYGQTCKELFHSRRVVRNGGFICGHDYHVHLQGVVRAVDDYCREFSVKPELWEDDPWASFCIVNSK